MRSRVEAMGPARRWRWTTAVCVAAFIAGCAAVLPADTAGQAQAADGGRFTNAYPAVGVDDGTRAPWTYFLRRAWVQLTRDLAAPELPPTVALDLDAMAARPFAVAWIGHATMLIRAGDQWLLTDPILSSHATPTPPFGPERLTPLPIDPDRLPRIDVVMVSHDHFDHLDVPTLRRLAAQPGGPPRFLAGRGLETLFREEVGVAAETFDWWQTTRQAGLGLTFVPAQHSSGRSLWRKNRTRWGGWVVDDGGARLYFAGDTAYSREMFADIGRRAGPIDLAALPIGAYEPRGWMRHEHVGPHEAVQAHRDLGTSRSVAMHWATFQLGDEEPMQPARDLAVARREAGVERFDVLAVGGVADVRPAVGDMQRASVAGLDAQRAPAELRAR